MPNVRLDIRVPHEDGHRWEKHASDKGPGAVGRLEWEARQLGRGTPWRIFASSVGIPLRRGVTA